MLLRSLLAATLLLATTGAIAAERREIRIATEGAFPPFNYVEQNNEPGGFEIDLAKALCEAMAASCTFVLQDWDGMIAGLKERRYDAIISSMAITPERRAKIAFSKRYYLIPAAFIGLKDALKQEIGPAALAGKRVGAMARSEHAAMLEDLYKGAEIRLYDKLDEANLDLLTGRLDLVLGDKLALSRFLGTREGGCCAFVADVPQNPLYHGEGVGVGLRKDDKELKAAFDRAIDTVQANGTYQRIRAKYFSFAIK